MKRYVVIVVLLSLGGSSGLLGAHVQARSIFAKPDEPSISVISSISRDKKLDVTVVFGRALTNPGSPLLSTQVRVGTLTCTASRYMSRCTVKGLSSGKTYAVSARARNRNGFGSWSLPVRYRALAGNTWRRTGDVSSSTTSSSSTSVASTSTSTSPSPSPNSGSVSSAELRFDFASAVGVGIVGGVSTASVRKASTNTNLVAIEANGKTADPIVSGSAQVARVLIAPNDKLYLLFKTSVKIGSAGCILAEVDRQSGIPLCVERDTDFRFVSAGQDHFMWTSSGGRGRLINDFQFDSQGGIYYLGVPSKWKSEYPGLGSQWSGSTAAVVRRFKNGEATDFGVSWFERGASDEPGWSQPPTSSVFIRNPIANFFVFPDGTVVVDQGLSLRGQPPVLRESGGIPACIYGRVDIYKDDGSRKSIAMPADIDDTVDAECEAWARASGIDLSITKRRGEFSFLKMFGDTKLIAGWYNRVFRFDVRGLTITRLPWLNYPERDPQCENPADFVRLDFSLRYCDGATSWRDSWKTPSGSYFAVLGTDPLDSDQLSGALAASYCGEECVARYGFRFGSGVVAQVFPSLASTRIGRGTADEDVVRVESFLAILDSVVVSGPGVDGKNRTVLYNTATGDLRTLIGSNENFRILRLGFNSGRNRLYFSGTKPNSAVNNFGFFDFSTGELSISSAQLGFEQLAMFSK